MASYGMERYSSFVEAPGFFGDLHLYLERDMGLGLPEVLLDNVGFFGNGEVDDPPTPPSPPPKKARLSVLPSPGSSKRPSASRGSNWGPPASLKVSFKFAPVLSPPSHNIAGASSSKGKAKILSGFSFNNDGLLSKEAIQIIDSGELSSVLGLKAKSVLNFDMKTDEGKSVKDVLEELISKKLKNLNIAEDQLLYADAENPAYGYMGLQVSVSFSSPKLELMDVEEVLLAFDKLDEGSSNAKLSSS
ncbi:hypothetical protein DCAR_0208927 [Daucus carota subsp. sativus]|uniref:Uncharacterized protein n=1 Tax=Daucus carota subsp. sativus TaxID=79200 RepID=A0A166EWH3_DAUCS|nr:hypothetical protein DCAR_0208927 [Daucus carota subsp. sativus]